MSYWVFPQFRGRGFASSAVRLVCGWAFEQLRIARIELYIEPDNVESRKVARRAGFSEEGVLREHEQTPGGRRDMVLYSLLPADLLGSQDS